MNNDNPIWQRNEIESPCVNICVLDRDSKLCIGCGRTGDEIARWSSFTSQTRTDIMSTLAERMSAHKPIRKGGRNRQR